jgi:hypothetical protein
MVALLAMIAGVPALCYHGLIGGFCFDAGPIRWVHRTQLERKSIVRMRQSCDRPASAETVTIIDTFRLFGQHAKNG